MMQRVRIPHRGQRPFVCHSTPHFDSTSRKASYSVAHIIHYLTEKVNPQFVKLCRKAQMMQGIMISRFAP